MIYSTEISLFLSLSLSFFLYFLSPCRYVRGRGGYSSSISSSITLQQNWDTKRRNNETRGTVSAQMMNLRNTVASHVYEMYTNSVVVWRVIVSTRGDKVPITRFCFSFFFFFFFYIPRRTAVRPGRLAARLRVNVLLVISGQLLRRTVPLPHLFLALFVFRLFLILCPSTGSRFSPHDVEHRRTPLLGPHCYSSPLPSSPLPLPLSTLCAPTLFFPRSTVLELPTFSSTRASSVLFRVYFEIFTRYPWRSSRTKMDRRGLGRSVRRKLSRTLGFFVSCYELCRGILFSFLSVS